MLLDCETILPIQNQKGQNHSQKTKLKTVINNSWDSGITLKALYYYVIY